MRTEFPQLRPCPFLLTYQILQGKTLQSRVDVFWKTFPFPRFVSLFFQFVVVLLQPLPRPVPVGAAAGAAVAAADAVAADAVGGAGLPEVDGAAGGRQVGLQQVFVAMQVRRANLQARKKKALSSNMPDLQLLKSKMPVGNTGPDWCGTSGSFSCCFHRVFTSQM